MNYKLYILILVRFSIIHGEEIQIAEETRPFVEYRKLCDTLNNLTVCGHLNAGAVLTPVVTLLLKGPCTRAAGRGVSLRAPKNLQFNYTLVMPVNTGSAGQALITDGNGNLSFSSVGGSSSTTAYVDGGNNFGADATVGLTSNNNLDIVTNSTARVRVSNSGDITLNSGKLFKFSNSGDTASVGLKAPAAIAADIILNLPDTAGAAGQFLQTDGANPATLTWANGGNVSGSGAANQVTYWSGANTITGSNNLTYNGTTTVTFGATGAFDSAGGITVSAPSGAGDALTVNANATDNALVVTGGAGATAQTITAGTAQSGLAITGNSATAVTISGGTGTKLAITGGTGATAETITAGTNRSALTITGNGTAVAASITAGADTGGGLLITGGAGTGVPLAVTGNSVTAVTISGGSGTKLAITGSTAATAQTISAGTDQTALEVLGSNGTAVTISGGTGTKLAITGGTIATAQTIVAGTDQSALTITGNGAGDAVSITAGTDARGLVVTGSAGATAQAITSGTDQSALTITGNGTAVAATITAGASTGGGLLITGGAGAGVPLNVTAAAGTGSAVTITGGNSATAATITPGTNRSALTITGNGTAVAVSITAGASTGGGLSITGGAGAGVPLAVTAAAGTGSALTVIGNTSATAQTITGDTDQTGLSVTSNGTSSCLKTTLTTGTGYALEVQGANADGEAAAGFFNASTTRPGITVSSTTGTLVAAPVNARLVVNGTIALPGGAGGIVATSDERIKKNITPIISSESLKRILALEPVEFEYTDDYIKTYDVCKPGTHHRGFIAQEFQKTYPEATSITPSMLVGDHAIENVLSIATGITEVDIINSIKELLSIIHTLEKRIQELEESIK